MLVWLRNAFARMLAGSCLFIMASNTREIIKQILLLELSDDTDVECAVTMMENSDVTDRMLLEMVERKKERNPDARIENFVEVVVPKYSDNQFKEHFRMYPDAFEVLCQWLAPYLPTEKTLSHEKKLLATLWLLGNPESYRGVADRFGIHKGTLHHIVHRVCDVLVDRRDETIKWPHSQAELQHLAADFENACGFPGAVGAVDGTYIEIKGPVDHTRKSYVCRKGYTAMHLQVVSTRGLLFLDVHTGYVGSVADSRVFRNSPLHTLLTSNDSKLPLAFHLLGDSAYPLSTYMMVPFRDNGHLTPVEVKFNAVHSSTRSHVERAIGLLKGKWRRLRVELDMTNRMEVPNIIFAACVLHNFVILNNGIHYEDILMERNQRQNPPCEEVPPVTATCDFWIPHLSIFASFEMALNSPETPVAMLFAFPTDASTVEWAKIPLFCRSPWSCMVDPLEVAH
ncbi:hypothetical protein BaRGS_00033974 [Batillaria attramentaria]|uniref:DDE Tnp4 domain-containing protein n=1 Tax=Batillaria attramentaria TaxID=370345 RepID=A0ABD0JJ61_9CAEN